MVLLTLVEKISSSNDNVIYKDIDGNIVKINTNSGLNVEIDNYLSAIHTLLDNKIFIFPRLLDSYYIDDKTVLTKDPSEESPFEILVDKSIYSNVMKLEYINGDSLSDVIRDMNTDKHFRLMENLATSLDRCTSIVPDLVFGDLAPRNIIITDMDNLDYKLIDFERLFYPKQKSKLQDVHCLNPYASFFFFIRECASLYYDDEPISIFHDILKEEFNCSIYGALSVFLNPELEEDDREIPFAILRKSTLKQNRIMSYTDVYNYIKTLI